MSVVSAPLYAQTQLLDSASSVLKQLWYVSTAQTVSMLVSYNPTLFNYVLDKLGMADNAEVQIFIKAATTNPPTVTPPVLPPKPGDLPIYRNSYTQMVSFGDSMSDTGALRQVTTSVTGIPFPDGPAGGRFCDGPVAVEVMASRMNLPLTNYALGGSTTGQGNVMPLQAFQKGVQLQIADHLANLAKTGKRFDTRALYVVWAGPNDFYARNGIELSSTATQAAANISTAVATLYGKGARYFFIPNMPDLSLTPSSARHEALDPGYKALALQRTNEYAAAMKSTLASLKKRYPQANFTTFDTLTYLRDQLPLVKAKGINTTDSCLQSTGPNAPEVPCADPSKYLFWDGNHPTAMANVQLGARFAAAAVSP